MPKFFGGVCGPRSHCRMKDSQPARYGAVSSPMGILRTCWLPLGYNSIVLFMSSEPHPESKSARDVFLKALEVHGTERDAYLAEACGSNAALRLRVEELLRSHRDDTFLEEPAAELGETVLSAAVALTEGPGTVIGRYKLLQQIGEGGMGVVYMAEQDQPVRRRVALKIIKVGMDTRTVVARFEAERQALALMDHPSIAKVFDAGATETGRPYFVMELVQGVPITEFCDKNKVPARERLKLFMGVCQAIQSAHQKGIIHRDIKPSNVLVTIEHGEPMPKVIDFGISKATNQKLTEKTLFTQFATMIGTPAYMSPEQAEMSSLDIDTRADIYSLGVLLYELLTGTTPFPAERLRSLAFGAMQRVILEEEPERPSTRLSTMADEQKTAVARNRGNNLSGLGALLRGDLDWIVMCCLEKDRRRRYETANALANDLKRHLENEPVAARPPSAVYRLQKMVRRNKGAAISVLVIASVIMAALIFSTAAFMRERAARLDAARAQLASDAQSIRADSVTRFMKGFFEGVIPEMAARGNRDSIKKLMDSCERLSLALSNAPLARAELHLEIGKVYSDRLYQYKFAFPQFRTAEEIASSVLGPAEWVGEAVRLYGLVAEMWDNPDGDVAPRVLETGRKAFERSSTNAVMAAWAYDAVSEFEMQYGKAEVAEGYAREALRLFASAPPHPGFVPNTEHALSVLVHCASRRGAISDAEAAAGRLLKLLKFDGGPEEVEFNTRNAQIFDSLSWGGLEVISEDALREAIAAARPEDRYTRGMLQRFLGVAVARGGNWQSGLEQMESLIPIGSGRSAITLWRCHFQLAVLMGRDELVRELLVAGLSQFGGDADSVSARYIAEALLLVPADPAMIPTLSHLTLKSSSGNADTAMAAKMPVALLQYRSGRFVEAAKTLEWFFASGEKVMGEYYMAIMKPPALFLRSAVHSKLGHRERAVEIFREGLKVHPANSIAPGMRYRAENWLFSCMAEILRREASALLEPQPEVDAVPSIRE